METISSGTSKTNTKATEKNRPTPILSSTPVSAKKVLLLPSTSQATQVITSASVSMRFKKSFCLLYFPMKTKLTESQL